MHIDPPRVRGLDTVALERDEVPILTRAADASARFDRPVVLAELDDLPRDRTVRLGARLLLGETQVVSRAVVSRFDSSRVVLLVLSSACRTLRCPPPGEPDATECESGRCVRPVCEGAACGLDAGAAEDDAASPEPDAALDSLPDAVVEPDRIAGGQGDDALRGEEEDGSGFGNDRYWLDGLGNDEIIDTGGDDDVARCAPGVRVERDSRDGTDRLLSFSTGGSARIRSSAVERILGCGCAL